MLLRRYVHLDLLGLGFSLLCQFQLQDAGMVIGLHILDVNRRWQRKGAEEAAIAPLNAMEVLFLLLFLKFSLTLHCEGVVLYANIQVLLLNTRNFELKQDLLFVLVNIDSRHKIGGG